MKERDDSFEINTNSNNRIDLNISVPEDDIFNDSNISGENDNSLDLGHGNENHVIANNADAAGNQQDAFNSVITQLAGFGQRSKEELGRHANVNAGFHDYEQESFANKKQLMDLCTLYRVFFESDPKFSKFLTKMQSYAALDPYTHSNYVKEMDYVTALPNQIDELKTELEKQEKQLQIELDQAMKKLAEDLSKKAQSFSEEKFLQYSKEEKEKLSREFTLKQEVLDNRRRALASFDYYFENLTKGGLTDLFELPEEIQNQINEVKAIPDHSNVRVKKMTYQSGNNNKVCFYIDSTDVKLDTSFDKKDLKSFMRGAATIGTATSTETNMRNAPIFPHEPRMTDVSQTITGACYLYTGLQELARLYPQKIKDMIVDNGDGTATVRFYARETDSFGVKSIYHPVYVRVDKTIPKVGFGALDRLGQDALWVNLIEKAYAMSGLHKTFEEDENLPVNLERTPDWKPTVKGIEGGFGHRFLENVLGEEGKNYKIDIPSVKSVNDANAKMMANAEKLANIKYVDTTSAESITKHGFYYYYKTFRLPDNTEPIISEEAFQKLDKNAIVELIKNSTFEISKKPYLEDAYTMMQASIQKVMDDTKLLGFTTKHIEKTVKNKYEKLVDKQSDKYEDSITADFALHDLFDSCHETLMEVGAAAEVGKKNPKDDFFNRIKRALDKGLPISCGTHGDTEMTKLADAMHAYSLIGAYKTTDIPPKYYFRIKNPQTKSPFSNGAEYVNEEGNVVGRWVNVKDGIFDITLEDFVHDYDHVNVNGTKALEAQKHNLVEGYNVITPAEITEYDRTHVTSDKLTDYMKVANDLYDAMISTNSVFSKDSEAYKNMVEGIKVFRHNLAMSYGREMKDIKLLTQPLKHLVEAYEHHVDEKGFRASGREKRRLSVCTDIHTMTLALENGENPELAFEKMYAKKLIEKQYEMNHLMDKANPEETNAKINEAAEKLYRNKAFRTIANGLSVSQMAKPASDQMKTHLKQIGKALEGRGFDKNMNLATMTPEAKVLRNVRKKPAKKTAVKNDAKKKTGNKTGKKPSK